MCMHDREGSKGLSKAVGSLSLHVHAPSLKLRRDDDSSAKSHVNDNMKVQVDDLTVL